MRLTLRTLLAYLDDVLEPAETRELGEKINESGAALQLVAKIKDVLRRRRLSAPAISGPGSGIDPNAVGEYLDDTLAPDQVANVEKVCLESDVHLAEVAACHQILTLALHEPVEIPTDLRNRLYALTPEGASSRPSMPPVEAARAATEEVPFAERPSKVTGVKALDAPPPDIAFPVPEQAAPVAAGMAVPAAPEIPEYLRSPSSRRKWMWTALVVMGAAVWLGVMYNDWPFTGAPSSRSPVKSGQNKAATVPGENATSLPPENPSPVVIAKTNIEPAEKNPKAASSAPVVVPAQQKMNPGGTAGNTRAGSTDVALATGTTKAPAVDGTSTKSGTPAEPSAAGKTAVGVKPEPPKSPESPKSTEPGNPPVPGTAPGAVAEPVQPPPATALYTSPDGVLLQYDKVRDGWFTLPRRSLIHPGDRLAVPEPFEGVIRVNDGALTVSLRGGTVVQRLAPAHKVDCGWSIQAGRLIVRRNSPGETPVSLLVRVRSLLWQLDLLTPEALCAIECLPVQTERFEQDLSDGGSVAILHVNRGAVRLTRPGEASEPVEIFGVESGATATGGPISAKSRREAAGGAVPTTSFALTPGVPAELLKTSPRWVAAYTPTSVQRKYATLFEKQFDENEKAELLTTDDRRPEIARMATDCLGLIGAYAPLVAVLHRSEHEEARKAAIEQLRNWLPRSFGNRQLLKQELAKQFPPTDAEIVYELLWGYTPDDLRNRLKSSALVDWMESSEIAIRELAFLHVSRLTRLNFDYRPNSSPPQLQVAVNRWRRHLAKTGALLAPLPAAPPPAAVPPGEGKQAPAAPAAQGAGTP